MTLIINGKSEDIQGSVILHVLKAKKIDARMVAVDHQNLPHGIGSVTSEHRVIVSPV